MTNETKETSVTNLEEKRQEKDNPNIIKVPIKHPIEIDGVLLKSITLDFSHMTGADLLKVDEELRLEGKTFDNIFNQHAILLFASKASKLLPDDLKRLHVADYMEVVFRTRNFFIAW